MGRELTIDSVDVSVYRIPTASPESDGTLSWRATSLVVCEITAGSATGIGYTYASRAAAVVIEDQLRDVLVGQAVAETGALWLAAWQSVRNLGRRGVCSMAIAAVDMALWDLRARYLDQPLYRLLGAYRPAVSAYGSGGFTSYTNEELQSELENWNALALPAAKIKIGRDRERDRRRIRQARTILGPETDLFVDANGAFDCPDAIAVAEYLAEHGVSWFEEPVTSDDVDGMARVRLRAPAGVRVVTGEYGYQPADFLNWLDGHAVDVLMADATRCAGVTGFMEIAALTAARHVPLSSHCAPTVHAHLGCAARSFLNAEYFQDHVRIEQRFFDGAIDAQAGKLTPDPARPGLGIELKRTDLERYAR